MSIGPEDVSEIFGESPKKNNTELFTELNKRLTECKTKQDVDAVMEDAKVLPESLLTILSNMSKYKRNELPEAVVKAKEAAPMEVMNQCITLLNNSQSFEELQSVLADNKELYAKLNNGQTQIITGIIDELSKKLPASIIAEQPVQEQPVPVVDTEIKDEETQVKPKRTRKVGKSDGTTHLIEVTPEYEALQEERKKERIASTPITINRRINLPINGVQYSNNESTYTITCKQSELDEALSLMNIAIKKDTRLYTKEDFDKAVAEAKKDTTYQAGVMDGIVTQNGGSELKEQLELEQKANEHFRLFINQLANDTTDIVIKNNGFEEKVMDYVRSLYKTFCETNPNPKKK